jgi:hypothetical protein
MNTAITNNVPRELPIAMLTESPTNLRRVFNEAFLKELASSIDSQGVLASLLVRPKNQAVCCLSPPCRGRVYWEVSWLKPPSST